MNYFHIRVKLLILSVAGCHISSNPSQPSVAFHRETSHLICSANQMTGFYMECNIGLKRAKIISHMTRRYNVLSTLLFKQVYFQLQTGLS